MEKHSDWIEVEITGINYASQANLFSKLFLKSTPEYLLTIVDKEKKNKKIQLLIDQLDGQGIAIALEKIVPTRPLVHDLFKTTIELLKSELEYIVIHKSDENYFYTYMKFLNQEVTVNARYADAIALALRFGCPIYIQKEVFEKIAINIQ